MANPLASEQSFFVLTALAAEPLHGYAILTEVSELSGGRIRLAVGTLYGIIDRLAERGLIALDREEIVASRLRRYYRLTDDGRGVLEAEVTRQAANARIARRRLSGSRRPAGPSTSPALSVGPILAAGIQI